MVEKIGNVTMDLTFYPGEDYYCDGTVEDDLLDIVMNHEKEEYGKIIEERNCWPVLYHLSPLRANIIDWLPIKEGAKGLEIGAGCGAVTGTLAGKCKELVSIDLSKKRSMINAYRNKERENLIIKVGNFKDIEPSLDTDYDYIFLIGVFEYAQSYIGGDSPYTEFLNIIKKHLAADGKIIIAIENKYGLKYWAGCREDHLGDYFSGIEDYPDGGVVRTFSRNGLEKICKECGINEYSFYYPYPDYKFMTTVYSDERLPKPGELSTNLRNMDRSRILLFDEQNAYDGIIRDGEFPLFSNSYLLMTGKEERTVYSKFSNDRAPEYAIRTDIVKESSGVCHVEKHALSKEAEEHLGNILHAGEILKQRYEGSGLVICDCEERMEDGMKYLVFPFLQGETLEERLDRCLEHQDMDGFYVLLRKYVELVRYQAEYQVTDYDLIFSNLLTDGDTWQLIDYEWTYDQFTPPDKIAYRALLCYCMGSGRRKELNPDNMAARLGLEGVSMEEQQEEELAFQMKVTGERLSLSQMRDAIHHEVLPLRDAVEIYQNKKAEEMVQIYRNQGEGFREDLSDFTEPCREDDLIHVSVPIGEDVKQIRLDPARYACLVTLEDITNYPIKKLSHNGIEIAPQVYLFPDDDPNFTLDCRYTDGASGIDIRYRMVRLDQDTVDRFYGKWKWRRK